MATIGDKIDKLFKLREDKRKLEAKIKAITDDINDTEIELMEHMDKEGTSIGKGTKASVSITSSVKPNVQDWDLYYAYIHKNKYYHLLERRPSVTACRELFETKGKIPGVIPFVQRRINLRKV
jgi:hypothetical protein